MSTDRLAVDDKMWKRRGDGSSQEKAKSREIATTTLACDVISSTVNVLVHLFL